MSLYFTFYLNFFVFLGKINKYIHCLTINVFFLVLTIFDILFYTLFIYIFYILGLLVYIFAVIYSLAIFSFLLHFCITFLSFVFLHNFCSNLSLLQVQCFPVFATGSIFDLGERGIGVVSSTSCSTIFFEEFEQVIISKRSIVIDY